MKSRPGIEQSKKTQLATDAHRQGRAPGNRIAVSFSDSDNLCRRVKIRVKAKPTSKAARLPQIFTAGSAFNEPRVILRTLEPSPPGRRPARKIAEMIECHALGEPDVRLEE